MNWYHKWIADLFPTVGDLMRRGLDSFLPEGVTDFILLLITLILVMGFIVVAVLIMTLSERKVLGRIQNRYGPNRVGPFGVLQPIADMLKLFLKEDVIPLKVDRRLYILAPMLVLGPALLVYSVVPFGRHMTPTDLNIGLLFVLAVSSVTTMGIVLGGWASNNKYSLIGGMRGAAQMISYEVPLALSVVGVVLMTGTLSMHSIVESQSKVWFILLQPIGFVVFMIAATAEANRSPFDLMEADSEIVAGYHTEYGGMKFGLFFLGEYAHAFAVAAIATTLFLGGWHGWLLPGYIWFAIKAWALFFALLWFRGTFARIRVDQLMHFGWKILVPLSLVNILLTAVGVSIYQALT